MTLQIKPGSVAGMEDFFLYTIEDFLSPTYFDALRSRIKKSKKFEIYDSTSYKYSAEDTEWDSQDIFDVGQVVYVVLMFTDVHDGEMFRFLEPAMFKIYDSFPQHVFAGVVRAKANVLFVRPDRPERAYNAPHVDAMLSGNTFPLHTAILYLSGNDGDTVIFKERYDSEKEQPKKFTEFMRVTPKPNTLLFFNSAYYHASSNPRYGENRCVINMLFNVER